MSEKNNQPASRRLIVALAAAAVLLALVVSAGLVLRGWRTQQAVRTVEPVGEPLTAQEIAEVKAAVEKQTGTPVRYVGPSRRGVVEVFPDVRSGRPAYRVKKTDEGWRVVEKFHAFFA